MATKICSAVIVLVAVVMTACSGAPRSQSKEAVERAVMEYLHSRQNVAVDKMDIEIQRVEFSGDTAQADVSFRAKGSPGPGMNIRYTLSRQGNGWAVNQRPGGSPNPHGKGSPGELPPGHPAVDGPSSPQPQPAPGGVSPPGSPGSPHPAPPTP